jgi:DNA-binding helix-hairpin-helix protein with protein kinase domain
LGKSPGVVVTAAAGVVATIVAEVVALVAAEVTALVATIRRFRSIQGTPLYFPYKRRALEVVKMRVNTTADPKQPKKCWTSESS